MKKFFILLVAVVLGMTACSDNPAAIHDPSKAKPKLGQGVEISEDSQHYVKEHVIKGCYYLAYGESIIHEANCPNHANTN